MGAARVPYLPSVNTSELVNVRHGKGASVSVVVALCETVACLSLALQRLGAI